MAARPLIRARSSLLAFAALFALAACDSGGGAAGGPGAVSEGEAEALDDAAEMLEQRRLPEGTLPPLDPPGQTGEEDNGEEAG